MKTSSSLNFCIGNMETGFKNIKFIVKSLLPPLSPHLPVLLRNQPLTSNHYYWLPVYPSRVYFIVYTRVNTVHTFFI